MTKLIVRRALSETCQAFLRVFAENRGLQLIVDRRRGDRRHQQESTPEDRRAGERRAPPPETWDRADFIAIDTPEE